MQSCSADFGTGARYAPLERIFSIEDYAYVEQMAGRSSKAARVFYRGRRRTGRRYLRLLRKEFLELHRRARIASIHADEDQPDVARTLLKEYVRFQVRYAMAHVALIAVASPLGTRLAGSLRPSAKQLIDACARAHLAAFPEFAGVAAAG